MRVIIILLKTSIIIVISITLNSCMITKAHQASKARQEFTEENNAIPPEFGSDDKTVFICILKGKNNYDKSLKKIVTENYKGKYTFITQEELKAEKYKNKEIYRYLFNYFGNGSVHDYREYFVKDRLEILTYQSGAGFSFFDKVLTIYMQNLELKRLSYQ